MKDGCPSDYPSTNLPTDPKTDPLLYLSLSFHHLNIHGSRQSSIHPHIHSVKSLSNPEHTDRRQSMQDQRVFCPSQGGGFGAGVVKAFEAHGMQCENSHCEWKHSAEAKPDAERCCGRHFGMRFREPARTHLEHPQQQTNMNAISCPKLAYTQSKRYKENFN